MFDNLSGRLAAIVKGLRGQARITEENMAAALREVRMALLEADVALPVATEFIDAVREQALGREVGAGLAAGQEVVKIVHRELVRLLGGGEDGQTPPGLNLKVQAPAVILLAGLQGAGKTTTAAKLGRWLRREKKKSALVTSCDVYRPAALEQLEILAADNELAFFPAAGRQPPEIAAAALREARERFMDVLIVDTAGRLHIDADMMREIERLHAVLKPSDTLFVVDSMMGQDAVNAARAFNEAVPLSGAILSKVDGDARGGAALSARRATGKPILFMGTGEKAAELELFHPERIASRILGMGDVLSLIEEAERKVDRKKAERLAKKAIKGKGFDLRDFQEQIKQMRSMGGLAAIMDKMPGMDGAAAGLAEGGERELARVDAVINSMTPRERRRPAVINGSRKKRIAAGSGTGIQDVNRVLKRFGQMERMMKKMGKKGGMKKLLRGMGGKLPPGFPS